ncbi:hypothetical protein [Nocardioides sp. SYSU DS0663]|uniref:hypothetical protein n=1 Tax=Nocardioides sp. SYSU DS0663 TaxID=3416445 RepID=UPI003F4BC6FF
MRRAGAGAALALAALAGCSSEEPPPVGADGSGTYRTAEHASATLTDADGEVVGRAEAEPDIADALELSVQATGLEPGTYRVSLVPGATCDDPAGEGPRGPRLPDLVVTEDGGAPSYSETTGLSLDDLDDGAALRLVGGPTEACGVLADY